MPRERKSVTKKCVILGEKLIIYCPHCGKIVSEIDTGSEGFITAGLYEDSTLGEIFITLSKIGETRRGFADAFARAISKCLQRGVPLQELVDDFTEVKFEPYGFTGDAEIRTVKSIVDYVFKWLKLRFLLKPEQEKTS
jgi:ribonucleoside-diphosphate reductase alpha chain